MILRSSTYDNTPTLTRAGDGNSTIKVLNAQAGTGSAALIKSIATGGSKRADELSYDPRDQVILIANGEEGFLTFINVATQTVATHFYYADNTVGQPATVSGHSTAGGQQALRGRLQRGAGAPTCPAPGWWSPRCARVRWRASSMRWP